MRSFRKAALAGATAVAVAFGSTSVAIAQEEGTTPPADQNSSQQDSSSTGSDETTEGTTPGTEEDPYDGSLSSKINGALNLEGDKAANGTVLFGSSNADENDPEGNEEDLSSQPAWAQWLYALTILGGIGSILGLIVGPIANFLNFHPASPLFNG